MRISEVFYTVQGEGRNQGRPMVFVRTQGCQVGCIGCDTKYGQNPKGGADINVGVILQQLRELNGDCVRVCLTGGEPLEQFEESLTFVTQAIRVWNYEIEIETSGVYPVPWDWPVRWIMDLKTPSSGVAGKNILSNLAKLKEEDDLVCVIADRDDFEYVRDTLDVFPTKAQVYLHPAWESGDFPRQLVEQMVSWAKKEPNQFRVGVQLHKLVWQMRRGV